MAKQEAADRKLRRYLTKLNMKCSLLCEVYRCGLVAHIKVYFQFLFPLFISELKKTISTVTIFTID